MTDEEYNINLDDDTIALISEIRALSPDYQKLSESTQIPLGELSFYIKCGAGFQMTLGDFARIAGRCNLKLVLQQEGLMERSARWRNRKA